MRIIRKPGNSRMVIKFAFPVLLFSLLLVDVWAKPVSSSNAQKVMQSWLNKSPKPLNAKLSSNITKIDTFSDSNGLALYYVIYLQPDGFIIVSADDTVEPIIAFAESGTFRASDDNPLGALVINDLPSRISAARQFEQNKKSGKITNALAYEKTSTKAARQWLFLSEPLIQTDGDIIPNGYSGISDVRVAPFVMSLWGQGNIGGYVPGTTCYNYYTPNNWPCGCVAAAMAQLMRYHQYPTAGIGLPYKGGNGSGGPYVWSNMPLDPQQGITLTQRQAIGALCYDAAESVDTVYGSGGSTASVSDASQEFEATFFYGNSIYGYNPSVGTALNNMINPNLDSMNPVIIGVNGPVGGHAVVCDGYGYISSTLYHHINMGWDGTDNAWYNLPNIDSSPYFNSVTGCAYNVFTSGAGEIVSGRVTNMTGSPIPNAMVSAGGGTYQATTNQSGIYALIHLPSSQSYTVNVSKAPYTFTNQNVSTGTSSDYSGTSGNKWAINFAAQTSGPPIAYDKNVSALSGITTTINLIAADDGLPNPPAQMSYIIAALPHHGTLTDPSAGVIATVPYTLVSNGNAVQYCSCSYFTGQDSFYFKATDSGTPPQGGESDSATVTVDVNNIINTTFEPQTNSYASWPMYTSYHDSRTQVIYLASEIGSAKTITDLALDVYTAPGQALNNWTIRMKHTTRSSYTSSPYFETSGWTVVYQGNVTISSTGWQNFHFQNGFAYNGTNNLLIDFSHNNSSYSTDGDCMASGMSGTRVILSFADSTHGDPLTWTDYTCPGLYTATAVPNLKLVSQVQGSPPIDGDLEKDCNVDLVDLAIFSDAWLSTPSSGSWNSDCNLATPADSVIDMLDLAVLAGNWLEAVP